MTNDWDSSLFNCFADIGTCILAMFLPCIPYAQNADEAGNCGCIPALISFFVPILDLYVLADTRRHVREKHNISGSFIGDCFASILCPCCVIIQTKNQLNQGRNMGETIERV